MENINENARKITYWCRLYFLGLASNVDSDYFNWIFPYLQIESDFPGTHIHNSQHSKGIFPTDIHPKRNTIKQPQNARNNTT
jgi:hypothetical protein